MIGPLEIVIVALILLLLFGGYRVLPALGRAAGRGARVGGEKAKELGGKVSERADRIDTDRIARSAGEGVREVRELREAVSGRARDDAGEPRSERPETGGEGSSVPERRSGSEPTDSG